MSLYGWLMLGSLAYPLAQSFEWRLAYYKKWIFLFPAILLTALLFIIWDYFFTEFGIWGFNPDYLIGIYFINLPIEEISFFLIVPFASVFVYEVVIYFFPTFTISNKHLKIFYFSLGFLLIILAGLFHEKTYTFINFSLCGVLVISVARLCPFWLSHFTIAYFLHLIPFLLVNGILTGAITNEPIVWYNNEEIIGIRLHTIPIEDTQYALLLFLLNIFLYEYFKKGTGIVNNSLKN